MARKTKLERGDLTLKDMSTARENDRTVDQSKATHYQIRDYSLQHRVHIYRDLNDEANRDLIFRMTIDDVEVLLDAEQVMRAIRWV